MYLYFKKDTIFAADFYGIYKASRSILYVILYLLLITVYGVTSYLYSVSPGMDKLQGGIGAVNSSSGQYWKPWHVSCNGRDSS